MFKYFVLLFIPLAAGLGAIGYFVAENEVVHDIDILRNNEQNSVDHFAEIIEKNFSFVFDDLFYLSESSQIRQFLESGNGSPGDALIQEICHFAEIKEVYDQIRLIKTDGRECLRINAGNGTAFAVDDSLLQDKSHQYYFKEGIARSYREVYISPMDLNLENGTVERPLKPVIRTSVPVFDSAGEKKGILVMNVLSDFLLSNLMLKTGEVSGEVNLLNSDGYWLLSPDKEKEWGFVLEERSRFLFGSEFPDAWKAVTNLENGQILLDSGLFTFTSVNPYSAAESMTAGSTRSGISNWNLILHIPQAVLTDLAQASRNQFLQFYIALFVILVALSLFLAINLVNRRISEAALKDSEYQFRSVAQSANDAIVSVDSDGKIIFWNEGAGKIFGYSSGEVTGKTLSSLIPLLSNEVFKSEITKAANKKAQVNKNGSMEVNAVHKNGNIVPVELSLSSWYKGNRRFFTGIVRDISDRKKWEMEISESNALLQSVIHSPENINIASIDSGYNYLLFNEVHRKAVKEGWNTDIEKGMNTLDVISFEEDRISAKEAFDRALSGETFMEVKEYGEIRRGFFESLYSPIINDAGEVIGFTVFSTNVTKRVHSEQNKLQQERLKGVLEMAGATCHEFNQPLQVILGYASLISAKLPDGDPLKKKLEIILNQVERMGELTSNLQNITEYKTTDYLDQTIIDIDASASGDDGKDDDK